MVLTEKLLGQVGWGRSSSRDGRRRRSTGSGQRLARVEQPNALRSLLYMTSGCFLVSTHSKPCHCIVLPASLCCTACHRRGTM